MEQFVMLIWLTTHGPEIKTEVPDCHVASEWYLEALKWAVRSDLTIHEPGYLCGPVQGWRLVRAHR
jgi:hypothetical protein